MCIIAASFAPQLLAHTPVYGNTLSGGLLQDIIHPSSFLRPIFSFSMEHGKYIMCCNHRGYPFETTTQFENMQYFNAVFAMCAYASPEVGGFQGGHVKVELLFGDVSALCRNAPITCKQATNLRQCYATSDKTNFHCFTCIVTQIDTPLRSQLRKQRVCCLLISLRLDRQIAPRQTLSKPTATPALPLLAVLRLGGRITAPRGHGTICLGEDGGPTAP